MGHIAAGVARLYSPQNILRSQCLNNYIVDLNFTGLQMINYTYRSDIGHV